MNKSLSLAASLLALTLSASHAQDFSTDGINFSAFLGTNVFQTAPGANSKIHKIIKVKAATLSWVTANIGGQASYNLGGFKMYVTALLDFSPTTDLELIHDSEPSYVLMVGDYMDSGATDAVNDAAVLNRTYEIGSSSNAVISATIVTDAATTGLVNGYINTTNGLVTTTAPTTTLSGVDANTPTVEIEDNVVIVAADNAPITFTTKATGNSFTHDDDGATSTATNGCAAGAPDDAIISSVNASGQTGLDIKFDTGYSIGIGAESLCSLILAGLVS